MHYCYYCKSILSFSELKKNRLCSKCGSDLHCCKNCAQYNELSITKCREPNSPWIKDRVSQNNCIYFEFRKEQEPPSLSSNMEAEKAKLAFKALFK